MDDEQTLREVLGKELRASGYETVDFANKEDGYDWACENHVDLIISDLGSPTMDGLSLLRYLKENPTTDPIPVMIVTGFVSSDVAIRCKKHGAVDFVSKPYDLNDLMQTIERVLRGPAKGRDERSQRASSDLFMPTREDVLLAPWYRIRRLLVQLLGAQQARTMLFDQSYWWTEQFLIEDGTELVGCCVRRPTRYGRLPAHEIYGFKRWLDSQGLRFGVMYPFVDAEPADVEFAELLGISVAPATRILDMLLGIARQGSWGWESLVPSEGGLRLSPLAGQFQTFLGEALQKAQGLKIPVVLTIDTEEPGKKARSVMCEYTEHGSFSFRDESGDSSLWLSEADFSSALARLWRRRRIEQEDLSGRKLLSQCLGELLLLLGLATRSDNTYYLKGG